MGGSSPPAGTGSSAIWDQNGGKQKEFEPFGDLALRAVFADEDAKVVAGDWSGEVRVISTATTARSSRTWPANPDPIASRLERAKVARAGRARPWRTTRPRSWPRSRSRLTDKDGPRRQGAARATTEAQQDAAAQSSNLVASIREDGRREGRAPGRHDRGPQGRPGRTPTRPTSRNSTAEKAVVDTVAAEKAASRDAIAGSKVGVDKALNDKVAQDQALASAVETLKSATHQGRPPIRRDAASDPGRGPIRRADSKAVAIGREVGRSKILGRLGSGGRPPRPPRPGMLATAVDREGAARRSKAIKVAQICRRPGEYSSRLDDFEDSSPTPGHSNQVFEGRAGRRLAKASTMDAIGRKSPDRRRKGRGREAAGGRSARRPKAERTPIRSRSPCRRAESRPRPPGPRSNPTGPKG